MSLSDISFIGASILGPIGGYIAAHFGCRRRWTPFLIVLSLIVALLLTNVYIQLAHAAPAAEKKFVRGPDGYVCELTINGTLGKSVCRLPSTFANYYVIYIEMNPDSNRVFIDTYRPTTYDDIMMVTRQNMSIDEFEARYGP